MKNGAFIMFFYVMIYITVLITLIITIVMVVHLADHSGIFKWSDKGNIVCRVVVRIFNPSFPKFFQFESG